jgi:hypothetical protein
MPTDWASLVGKAKWRVGINVANDIVTTIVFSGVYIATVLGR